MRAWLKPADPRSEALLAGALAVGAVLELAANGLLHTPEQAVVAALVALPLAVRFRWPLPVTAAVGAAGALESARVHDQGQVWGRAARAGGSGPGACWRRPGSAARSSSARGSRTTCSWRCCCPAPGC